MEIARRKADKSNLNKGGDMGSCKILCIDDDREFLVGMRMRLKGIYQVITSSTVEEGLAILKAQPIDLVLLDVDLGADNGIEGILKIKAECPMVDVAMLSGEREPKLVVEAIRAGAIEYLTKPFDVEDLEAIVAKQEVSRHVRERLNAHVEDQNKKGFRNGIVHRSKAISNILAQTEQLRGHDANVLIAGETGTGKELLARYIHSLEGNPSRPFIAVNCAAIPDNLIEAELFGSEAGAYTGSIKRRIGKFELADGGDIFLDEVSALKHDLQAKILRVLQEHEFCRVGGNEMIKANFRTIAATNEPLEEKIGRGEFRIDLFHRLRVLQFVMPPLRNRAEDIPALVEHFLKKFSKDGMIKRFTPGSMSRLMAYHWPGNVRELGNVVQSLSILSPCEVIDESVFPPWALNGSGQVENAPPVQFPSVSTTVGALRDYIANAERHYIEYALRTCDGDKSEAAKILSLGRTTLYAKMRELGMNE